jgi:hypothetical protein
MREVNDLYANDVGLCNMPPYGDFCELIDGCNRSLIDNAKKTFVEPGATRQDDIARDDVAKVRAASALAVGGNSAVALESAECGVDVIPERCVYATSSNKTEHGVGTDSTFAVLDRVARSLNLDVDEEKKEYKCSAKSRREIDPVNEFDRKCEGLLLAFPDVFFLGRGYSNPNASLTLRQRSHLLHQFTTSAGCCRPLLFYLFDQLQRHSTISAMHYKVMSDRKGFSEFTKEFLSVEFQVRLRNAVREPHSKEGKFVLQKIMPVLTSAGSKTVFGAVERYESKRQILALARRFGPAPAFLTFAVDDVNHPTALRLAMRSSSNSDFPCAVSAEAHEALKMGFKFDEGDIAIPASWSERAKVLIKNPVGAALVYRDLVHDVLTILIGRKPSGRGGDNRRNLKTDVDRWDSESEPGIVGSADAFFGKTETTGRGSLHFHVVLWAGISPELLEVAADLPDVCKIIGEVLDSHYTAELPRHCHVEDLATKCMRRYANDSETFSKFETAKRAMQLPPCPADSSAAFRAHIQKTICTCGIHEHCFTCKKPPNGWHGCRLCMPRGFCMCTKPVQLGVDSVSGGVIAKRVGNQGAPVVMKGDLFPLKSPDNRTIVWEPKRRQLKALLPLPPRQKMIGSSSSSEDESGPLPFAKERREFILSQLHSAMRESGDLSSVEFDPSIDEGNWVFAALQEGLIQVRPESNLCSLTMAEFRTELMDHLSDHLSDVDNVRGSGRYIPLSISLCVRQWERNAERLYE